MVGTVYALGDAVSLEVGDRVLDQTQGQSRIAPRDGGCNSRDGRGPEGAVLVRPWFDGNESALPVFAARQMPDLPTLDKLVVTRKQMLRNAIRLLP